MVSHKINQAFLPLGKWHMQVTVLLLCCYSGLKAFPLLFQVQKSPVANLELLLYALQQDQHSKQSSAPPRLFLMENISPKTHIGGWGLRSIQRSRRIPAKASLWYEISVRRWPRHQSQASGKHKTQQEVPWPQKAPWKAEEITEAGDFFFFYFFVSENILNTLSMCSLRKLDEQLPGTEH